MCQVLLINKSCLVVLIEGKTYPICLILVLFIIFGLLFSYICTFSLLSICITESQQRTVPIQVSDGSKGFGL